MIEHSTREIEYRGFSLTTHSSGMEGNFAAAFNLLRVGEAKSDRITRLIDGTFENADRAHAAALMAAHKLVDLLLEDANNR